MSPVPAFEKGFVCIFVVCLSAMTMQLVGVRSATIMHFPINNDVPPGSQRTITWREDSIVKRQQPGDGSTATTAAADSEERETTKSEENGGDSRAVSFLDYWYVLLVVLIVVAVFSVCLCACFVKKKRQGHRSHRMEPRRSYRSPVSNPSLRQLSSVDGHSATHPHTSSSFLDPTSSPGSLSIDHTPIPSPQPSFTSSQMSARSSGRGSRRKRHRNHSPGHASSESEDTIKPNQSRSALSLGGSSTSSKSLGPMGMPRVIRTESQSSGEKSVRSTPSSRTRSHRRSNSSTVVKITPVVGGVDGTSLRSASSMASMASVGSNHSSRSIRSNVSNRSGVLMRSRSNSSPNTLVEVDVKVHLCNEEEREARSEIAAALAESARQLAQSAANFDQEEDEARQRRDWYSRSLPHHAPSSAPSLPFRPALGTTHSLPLHSNRRRLFTSYSSTNLPPHGREHVYTPNLPSSGPAPPMASLDRPRHMVSADHPNSTRHTYENYRKGSPSHWPPPTSESPLTVRQNGRLGSPSQRSQSSNSEYAPTHYHNMPLPPVHMRPQRLLSRRVSEPGFGEGGGVYQNHNPPFHGHVYPNRLRSVNGSKVANLDFRTLKSLTPRLNGVATPTYGHLSQPEDFHLRHEPVEVYGMRNENGSDSNTSTLCGSSHSSTMDNKNRLSRVSEKSEQNENDGDQPHVNQEDNEQGSPCNEGDGEFELQEMDTDPPVAGGQRRYPPGHDKRYLTMPNHYRKVTIQDQPLVGGADSALIDHREYVQALPLSPSSSVEMSPSVKQSPPPRKQKPRPLQRHGELDSDLRDDSREDKDTASVGSTLPRSPVSSTCLSSQSVQSIQSVRDDAALHDEHPVSSGDRERHAPSNDITHNHQAAECAPPTTATPPPPHDHSPKMQSLPRSGRRPDSATVSSAATNDVNRVGVARSQGQASRIDGGGVSRSQGQTPPNGNGVSLAQAHMDALNQQLGPQLSYPLQKLLSQPLRYDVDSDDIDLLDLHHGAHYHHHGNMHRPQLGHYQHNGGGVSLSPNVPPAHAHFHGALQYGSLDRRRLPHHTSFNPVLVRSSRSRTSPGLPNVVVPPPLGGGGITVDIDV